MSRKSLKAPCGLDGFLGCLLEAFTFEDAEWRQSLELVSCPDSNLYPYFLAACFCHYNAPCIVLDVRLNGYQTTVCIRR
jgi:hypothetical protein